MCGICGNSDKLALMAERPDKDRTTINLTGIKERIEQLRSDNAWKALSLTKKVTLLLEEYLDLLESGAATGQAQKRSSDRSANLEPTEREKATLRYWKKLLAGQALDKPEIIKFAALLDVDPTQLRDQLSSLEFTAPKKGRKKAPESTQPEGEQ